MKYKSIIKAANEKLNWYMYTVSETNSNMTMWESRTLSYIPVWVWNRELQQLDIEFRENWHPLSKFDRLRVVTGSLADTLQTREWLDNRLKYTIPAINAPTKFKELHYPFEYTKSPDIKLLKIKSFSENLKPRQMVTRESLEQASKLIRDSKQVQYLL